MMNLIRDGGYPMFFLLIFGFAGLAASGWYAFRPNRRSLGFVTWIGISVLFGTLQGTCADLGAVFSHVSRMKEGDNPVPVLLERDNNIPSLTELLAEREKLQTAYDRALAPILAEGSRG